MTEIRILRADEYDRLKGLHENDLWIPAPSVSRIVIAEEDGEIVGFWTLQLQPHAEPVWIRKDKRNGTILGRMWLAMREVERPFFAFSQDEDTEDYLKRLGMKELGYKVFHGGV